MRRAPVQGTRNGWAVRFEGSLGSSAVVELGYAPSRYQVRPRGDDKEDVDGTFSDATPVPDEQDARRDEENRREGLREKLLRSLETHRNRIAAEVDERSAELTARAAELDEEQARLVAAEAAVRERAARLEELGISADGEHAAAVDRLLTLVETRDAQIAELLAREPEPVPAPEPVSETDVPRAPIAMLAPVSEVPARAHLLFVPTGKRYLLMNIDGPAPGLGSEVALDGARFIVSKIAPSPLPADERRCAYLQPLK
jgi:hypothetical protein